MNKILIKCAEDLLKKVLESSFLICFLSINIKQAGLGILAFIISSALSGMIRLNIIERGCLKNE